MAARMDAQPQSRATVDQKTRNGALLLELLSRAGPQLRSQARRNAPNEADAEDALQDACLQFLRHYGGPLERASALPWLVLVVKRCAWRIGRRARREEPAFESGLPPESEATALRCGRRGPDELVEAAEETAAQWRLLDLLKPDERYAIVMVALGYSYREICERYGWTYTKVNRCLSEGRAALRAIQEGRDETS